jgi:hypothetical protein
MNSASGMLSAFKRTVLLRKWNTDCTDYTDSRAKISENPEHLCFIFIVIGVPETSRLSQLQMAVAGVHLLPTKEGL